MYRTVTLPVVLYGSEIVSRPKGNTEIEDV